MATPFLPPNRPTRFCTPSVSSEASRRHTVALLQPKCSHMVGILGRTLLPSAVANVASHSASACLCRAESFHLRPSVNSRYFPKLVFRKSTTHFRDLPFFSATILPDAKKPSASFRPEGFVVEIGSGGAG